MRHKREDVIERANHEFALLDELVARISGADWERPVPRPESKDPWTVKDSLAHIIYWQANMVRSIRKQRRPLEERGLDANAANHLVFERWHGRSPEEVLAWYRQTKDDLLAALREAPDAYFSGKERNPQWPYDLEGHSVYHRARDIERALAEKG